ncbi:hypothetical protein FGSG_13816 [Fusarium graminearum PH-1]|uniref:Chromosome 1, complete genome n=1 Tax=Gibberella zeae (strain ATCC MYA-4620 / CBS 123657 / FGSC 9075 / NRRL 31084 / PH-1) TaxID=229533 RepID=I1SAD5_GIBZE|nr:hypothetical protein FGSG_13816 [Fusarium graminearum PH-1]ESU17459.1 hypothetical protein FGSG_13816 [Fusarium graminearum PH-1]CAF3434901.1 unnamed protein product [Fusarium graminearum]CEF76178.1 unnamed protein product [Fusarium graminearum]|eukprot:XP_011319721.1 hypothetical protein FGSG_13816 [Fusarium graminearum PH-1]
MFGEISIIVLRLLWRVANRNRRGHTAIPVVTISSRTVVIRKGCIKLGSGWNFLVDYSFETPHAIYVGNFSRVDDVQAAPIQFTFSNNKLKASPNMIDLPGDRYPTWLNKSLIIPDLLSALKTIKIVNSTDSASNYISDFIYYGSFFMAKENRGMLSLWYR